MRRVVLSFAVFACMATAPLAPAAASAAAPLPQVVADCADHGALTHHYTIQQLRSALSHISVDVAEYTNCVDVIRTQLNAQLGLAPGAGNQILDTHSSGSSFLSTGVIIVLIVVLLGGGGFAAVAANRRRGR